MTEVSEEVPARLRPGLWLGQENRIVSMTEHYLHGWSVHDSTGEDYTQKQHPNGLRASTEQWIDVSERSLHAWPELVGERDELAARVVSLEETLTAESRRLQQVAEDRNELAALLEDVANEASRPEVLADRARAILDRSTPE